MKRIISRYLLTLGLAVLSPLPFLWLMEASAQQGPAPKAQGKWFEARKEVSRNPDPRDQADRDRDERTRKLLSDYSRTDDEKERARVLEELTKVVSEQFERRQEIRERELKEVEEHVRKLRELHQRRAKEKDQIVRDRVRQLLRDVDGLGWGDDGPLEPARPLRASGASEK
jgi:hypothetical protein